MLSQPNYPSSCQHPWFLGFMSFWARNAVFSLNGASWRGSGLRSVPVQGFLNKMKLVSLRVTPCSRCMDVISSLLSSSLWAQLVPAQLPVWVTPKATVELSPCPCWEQLCSASHFTIRVSHPLVPHFAFMCSALVHTKWAKVHFIGSRGHKMPWIGRDI